MNGSDRQRTSRHAHDEGRASVPNRGAPDSLTWRHFWFSTFGTWLRGDERGFRDHDHRIHSSGDYASPPPHEEHANLRRWVRSVMHKAPVRLDPPIREAAGRVIVGDLRTRGVGLIALAVASDHVHGLGRFPAAAVREIIGCAKRRSSHAVRSALPGTVWAKRCGLKRIADRVHQRRVFRYIEDHRAQGAWVWTFRDSAP